MRFRSRFKDRLVDIDVRKPGTERYISSGSYNCRLSNTPALGPLDSVCKTDVGVITETETIEDVVTPDFFRRKKNGEILPTNACTRKLQVTHDKLYSMSQVYLYRLCNGSTKLSAMNQQVQTVEFIPREPKGLFSSQEIDAARAEAAARVRSLGMDALTTLVEGRQTLAMLLGAKKKLIITIKDLLKTLVRSGRKPKTLHDLIDAASSPWLEARFGWRILYYDLIAIRDYLDKRDKEISLIVGRSKIVKKRTEVAHGQTFLFEESVNFGFPGYLDYAKIGNSSIANTVWEIVPFSLVVDMFFDVQERIISHSGAPINVKLLEEANFQTTKRSCLSIAQAVPWGTSSSFPYSQTLHEPTAISALQSTYVRVHDRGIPSKWPTFKLSLGGYKPVDLFFLSKIIFDRIK